MSFLDRLFGNTRTFSPPEGINFRSPQIELNELIQITSNACEFFKSDYDDQSFWLFDDWLEFDGTHFPRKKIDSSEFEQLLTDSKRIFEARRADFLVYTGISPASYTWYLRYNIDTQNEAKPICLIDVSIPYIDAERFKELVIDKSKQINFHQTDANDFYHEIIKESQSN